MPAPASGSSVTEPLPPRSGADGTTDTSHGGLATKPPSVLSSNPMVVQP
jgi:hypothetical protein